MKICDASTGKTLVTIDSHRNQIHGVAWSPDSSRLALASDDGTADIWDAKSGSRTVSLLGHGGPVYDITWLPDGSRVATDSTDGTIRLWNPANGLEVLRLSRQDKAITAARFSPNGLSIASTDSSHIIEIDDAFAGFATERSPAILGELARRIACDPNDLYNLRLRAELHAAAEQWDLATSDAREFLLRSPATRCYVTGWAIGSAGEASWQPLPMSAAGYLDVGSGQTPHAEAPTRARARIFAPSPVRRTICIHGTQPQRITLDGSAIYPSLDDPKGVALELTPGWHTLIVELARDPINQVFDFTLTE